MFHKISSIKTLDDYVLLTKFLDGTEKAYDVKPLFDNFQIFTALKDLNLFKQVKVDVGGYGIYWNEKIDISCDELWENGIDLTVK